MVCMGGYHTHTCSFHPLFGTLSVSQQLDSLRVGRWWALSSLSWTQTTTILPGLALVIFRKFTRRCLSAHFFAPKVSWTKQCFDNRRADARFRLLSVFGNLPSYPDRSFSIILKSEPISCILSIILPKFRDYLSLFLHYLPRVLISMGCLASFLVPLRQSLIIALSSCAHWRCRSLASRSGSSSSPQFTRHPSVFHSTSAGMCFRDKRLLLPGPGSFIQHIFILLSTECMAQPVICCSSFMRLGRPTQWARRN